MEERIGYIMALGVGDRAAGFKLQNQDGELVDSEDLLGKGELVLFFYPKDGSVGCTMEVGEFRDKYSTFTDSGVTVIGVSSDSVRSHKEFHSAHSLPFDLLSDVGGRLREVYGASKLGIPGRVTYVIDSDGVIRKVFSSQIKPKQHIKEALAILPGL
jgi:peroxiredoxin Q/BCP